MKSFQIPNCQHPAVYFNGSVVHASQQTGSNVRCKYSFLELVRMADFLVSLPLDGTGLHDVTDLASISC